MVNDRGEMHDLADSSEHQAVLREHRRRLADWCEATKDKAFVNDPLLAG